MWSIAIQRKQNTSLQNGYMRRFFSCVCFYKKFFQSVILWQPFIYWYVDIPCYSMSGHCAQLYTNIIYIQVAAWRSCRTCYRYIHVRCIKNPNKPPMFTWARNVNRIASYWLVTGADSSVIYKSRIPCFTIELKLNNNKLNEIYVSDEDE